MPTPANKQPLIIGIFGSNGKTSTISLLYRIFSDAGLHVKIVNDKNRISNKKTMTNIEGFKQLKKFPNNDIIIFEVDENLLRSSSMDDIVFDILIHAHISEGSYESSIDGLDRINTLISSGERIKKLILNTDDLNWKNIVVDLECSYLITYGLGSKATVTASSIECDKEIHFCYCLQRSLTSNGGGIIEPMELPVVVKTIGQYNVYNSLAAITAALVCGVNTSDIKLSLSQYAIADTGLKILYENGFSVVDNVCDNYAGFETGFEAIQYMPYANIFMALNDDAIKGVYRDKLFELLTVWCATLKVKKIFCLTPPNSAAQDYNVGFLRKYLLNTGTVVEGVSENLTNVEGIIYNLREKDMLLFFCSSELNYIRENIIEILDKRILGDLSRDAD